MRRTGTVYGRVTGASKAVTFTAADTVVVRPNSRNGQDVVLGGKVVASTSSATAALRVTWTGTRAWTGRAATVQVTGTGIYRSHSAQAYRYGEMAVTRTGTTLNLVNVLRLGDEYVRGVPESPFYWGPHGAAALQAQALAARTFAYTAYRAGVSSACDCHVYDGTMSQIYDGYRVDQDPNARYWASAISATTELGDHLPGAADQRDVLLRLRRPDDGRARRVGRHRALPAQRRATPGR